MLGQDNHFAGSGFGSGPRQITRQHNVLLANVYGPSTYPAGCPLAERPCPSFFPVSDPCEQVVGLPCGSKGYMDTEHYEAKGFLTSFSSGGIAVLSDLAGSTSGAASDIEGLLIALNYNGTIDNTGVLHHPNNSVNTWNPDARALSSAKWDDDGSSVLPPLQTPIQRQLVATLTTNAALASNRATPHLLSALGDSKLSGLLKQRGLPELAALPPAELLARLRAEAAVSEITHNLALGNGSVGRHGPQACVECDGWAPGDDSGMSRTPLFAMETLPSLWALGVDGSVSPRDVAGWMRGADSVECGILGCPAFTGSLPGDASGGSPARPPYWPRDATEAQERPIYAVLDLHKLDAGVPDFGPVAIVMNRTSIAPLTALMPADMGLWARESRPLLLACA